MTDFDNYLNQNINDLKEKSNTHNFYDIFYRLNNLYNTISVTNKLLRSQGKYNSHICFIFKNEEHYKSCIKSLKRVLNVYKIDIWDILILYSEKTDSDYENINIISEEINIVNPIIIYIFDDNSINDKISNRFSEQKIVLGCRIINVNNIEYTLDNNTSSHIFDLFKYLITYNY